MNTIRIKDDVMCNSMRELHDAIVDMFCTGCRHIYKANDIEKLNMYAFEFDESLDSYIERRIYALTVFDGELAVLLDGYDYENLSTTELEECEDWQTIYGGMFSIGSTLISIAEGLL